MDNKKFILHRTVYDWLLEAIAFLGMAGTVIPACYMGKSTNPIPVHFNFRGEPDAWGNASELEYLAIISIILYILLTAIEFVYPIFNSLTGSTEKNALLVKRAQIRLIRHLKALTTLMTANQPRSIFIAHLRRQNLHPGTLCFTLIYGSAYRTSDLLHIENLSPTQQGITPYRSKNLLARNWAFRSNAS